MGVEFVAIDKAGEKWLESEETKSKNESEE